MKAKHKLFPLLAGAVLGTLSVLAFRVYESYLPPMKRKEQPVYPYGLLLGCPSHDDGTMSSSQIRRCDLAIRAWKQGLYQTLIISGGANKNEYVESEEMAAYIQKRADIDILLEREARTTWANLENTRNLIGDVPILIMTGSLHGRRASAMAAHFFSNYAMETYPDWKPRHILREIPSRWIYIQLERKKKTGRSV